MKVFAIVATLLAGSAMAAQQAAAPKPDAANAPTFGNLLDIMSKVVEAIGERVPELQSDAASVSASSTPSSSPLLPSRSAPSSARLAPLPPPSKWFFRLESRGLGSHRRDPVGIDGSI
uniref:Uncharacterized protein n=1 Tax=Bionectria ochroleuca TaxID=29856 RepID=A0A8H7TUB3_BIOOC